MKRLLKSPLGITLLIVVAAQLYYELIYIPSVPSPTSPGIYTPPPTTKRDLNRLKQTRRYSLESSDSRDFPKSRLPYKFRDFSKYQEEQLKLGRTKKQIDEDLEREIRKLLKAHKKEDIYLDLLEAGVDPEYDLGELDEGLDEHIPEY